MTSCWRIVPGQALLHRGWDGACVLYNDLSGDTQVTLYVPAGCAHGFQALTDPADVSYRIDRPHDPAEDLAVAYDDPDLALTWPREVTMVSARDRAAGSWRALLESGHLTHRP